MAMPRFDGGTSFTTSPSILRIPDVISSRPAIDLSKVDLPQPDGPTKTMNSPDLMSRSMPWRMLRLPYDFFTWFRVTSAGRGPCSSNAWLWLTKAVTGWKWRAPWKGSSGPRSRQIHGARCDWPPRSL